MYSNSYFKIKSGFLFSLKIREPCLTAIDFKKKLVPLIKDIHQFFWNLIADAGFKLVKLKGNKFFLLYKNRMHARKLLHTFYFQSSIYFYDLFYNRLEYHLSLLDSLKKGFLIKSICEISEQILIIFSLSKIFFEKLNKYPFKEIGRA